MGTLVGNTSVWGQEGSLYKKAVLFVGPGSGIASCVGEPIGG